MIEEGTRETFTGTRVTGMRARVIPTRKRLTTHLLAGVPLIRLPAGKATTLLTTVAGAGRAEAGTVRTRTWVTEQLTRVGTTVTGKGFSAHFPTRVGEVVRVVSRGTITLPTET